MASQNFLGFFGMYRKATAALDGGWLDSNLGTVHTHIHTNKKLPLGRIKGEECLHSSGEPVCLSMQTTEKKRPFGGQEWEKRKKRKKKKRKVNSAEPSTDLRYPEDCPEASQSLKRGKTSWCLCALIQTCEKPFPQTPR